MEDDRLGSLLRELPREQAHPGFTARVLERLDAAPRNTPRWSFRLALAAAVATLAAVAISAGVLTREPRDAGRDRQALQELRAEHGRLEQELREISAPPVVYLGGDENVDLVLDLGKIQDPRVVTPAAYHEETF